MMEASLHRMPGEAFLAIFGHWLASLHSLLNRLLLWNYYTVVCMNKVAGLFGRFGQSRIFGEIWRSNGSLGGLLLWRNLWQKLYKIELNFLCFLFYFFVVFVFYISCLSVVPTVSNLGGRVLCVCYRASESNPLIAYFNSSEHWRQNPNSWYVRGFSRKRKS